MTPAADWSEVALTVEPNPDNAAIYDELSAAYTSLYPATREEVHLLARIQGRPSLP